MMRDVYLLPRGLDVSLQKKLLQVGDSSGATEYLKAPDTVKRAILEGLIEYEEDGSDDIIDDEQLFGSDHLKGHEDCKIIKPVGVVSPTSVKTVSGSSQVFDHCLPKQVDVDFPDYSEMKNSLCSMSATDVKADDTLRKQALQMGYAPDIIEEALIDFESTNNPDLFDFLAVLEAVKIKEQNKSSNKAAILNESKTSLAAESEGILGHSMTAAVRKGKTKPVSGGTGAPKRAHVSEGKAKNTAGTSGGSQVLSHLDSCSSVIVIEDSDADDSICIVDAFPRKHSSQSDNIGGLPAEEREKMLLQQKSLKHKYQNQLSAGSSHSRTGVQTHTASSNKKRHKKKISLDTETVPRNRPEGWKKLSQESFSSVVTDKSLKMPQQASRSYYSDQQRREMAGAVQKEYTDDKEQTCVLRLYKNDTSKPDRPFIPDNQLRFIVIDGSNVAMSHGNDKVFSCKGIELCVNYFIARGHKQITAFVPEWRKYRNQQGNSQVIDIEILESLKGKGYLVFTPCRRLPGRWIASHDDRYILNLAVEEDAVVVSNDQYREFVYEKATYKHIIENRLLPYTFVKDHFMPPDDPLGRNGPTLDEFLRKAPWKSTPMQHSKKVPVIASVAPQQPQHSSVRRQQPVLPTVPGSLSLSKEKKRPPDVTESLFMALKQVFPNEDQDYKIRAVLDNHETETDLNRLTNYCMSALFL
ncbi:NEDD4-binding protein 1-like [Pomacea canaliculata]|uniref:NEDD4-binding protein 1-like n=1 Tax=Pomacea canaliculata TaxID=400727 RepID=UPI000D73274C|nr:NEDD4-binding protein 1-like [Pomacea canaliculata]